MSPLAAFAVIVLAVPLDSPDYRVRERARVQLDQADRWGVAVLAFAYPSAEVNQAARRVAQKWPRLWWDQFAASMGEDEDKLIHYAIHGPIEDRPWRRLSDHEDKIADIKWGPWAASAWRSKIAAPLRKAFPGDWLSPFDVPDYVIYRGQVCGCIFAVRLLVELGKDRPTHEDW